MVLERFQGPQSCSTFALFQVDKLLGPGSIGSRTGQQAKACWPPALQTSKTFGDPGTFQEPLGGYLEVFVYFCPSRISRFVKENRAISQISSTAPFNYTEQLWIMKVKILAEDIMIVHYQNYSKQTALAESYEKG